MDTVSTLLYTVQGHDPDISRRSGTVELLVSCDDLPNLDVLSQTDPMCVLFVRQFGQWKELARTEAVGETLSPQFTETFILDYDTEQNVSLMFSVYDIDCKSNDLRRHEHVGSVETTLGDLVKPDQMVTNTFYTLRVPGDPKGRGEIRIVSEFVRETRSRLQLHLGACKLDKKGLFNQSKTNTYIEICRSVSSTDFHAIHRTETFPKSQNPRWRPFEISVQKLSNGDPDRLIQFRCWHLDSKNQRQLLGVAVHNIRKLTSYKGKNYQQLTLLHISSKKRKKPSERGILRFLKCRLDMAYTLLDYVRGGCNVKFMVAVDFTLSNGDPTLPASLHYLGGSLASPASSMDLSVTLSGSSNSVNSGQSIGNQYTEAIKGLGSLLSRYDLEQQFPAYGFGAKRHRQKKDKGHFALNGSSNDPYCKGIEGILDAYQSSVGRTPLGGPSRLAPVLQQAVRFARDVQPTQDQQSYWICMIITDGVVNDIDETVEELIKASSLPLSVVIVGVGPADFALMEQFQTTADKPLQSPRSGKIAERDNVCFAALRKHKYVTGTNAAIARETLAEVSSHLVSFFTNNDIVPNRPTVHSTDVTLSQDEADGDDVIDFRRVRGTQIGVNQACRINKFSSVPGPMCPTCGASIEDI